MYRDGWKAGWLLYATVFLMATGTMMGQGSGTIQGTISDPTGAVIPGASVTAAFPPS